MVMVFLLLSAGEVNQDVPLWKKLSYSIGYSGGICYRGGDLASTPTTLYDPIGILACNIYFLNSIEAGVIYPFGNGEGIEVGVGYGWARIEDARKLGDCRLNKIYLSCFKKSGTITGGVEIILAKSISEWYTLEGEKFYISRYYAGGGIIVKWQWEGYRYFDKFCLSPEVSLRLISFAREFKSDAPWNEEKKIFLVFSGLYMGLKLKIGGIK